ncbi:MAG: hypothetical protein U0165_02800 [Polyangiaceae bacterium]
MTFDPSAASLRLERMWALAASFGMERSAYYSYLNESLSDRYALINGLQLLRDELQFAFIAGNTPDIVACGADLSLPSVVTTLAHTNCGDRIHQGEATLKYEHVVAARFATMSEIGELKLEAFSPTGGGTDDGATLAHVTVAHQLDDLLRHKIYEGNRQSFVLVNIDLKTHVGRLDDNTGTTFGRTQESPYREARSACGAIVGTLKGFNEGNAVHRRLRSDLGEENFEFLSKTQIKADDGTDITFAVAAAIVAIQGMRNTAQALTTEMDERGMAHLTAGVTVNIPSADDTVIYLARSTVFNGEVREQGLGTNAKKYGGKMIEHKGDKRLLLTYDGHEETYERSTRTYAPRHWGQAAPVAAAET